MEYNKRESRRIARDNLMLAMIREYLLDNTISVQDFDGDFLEVCHADYHDNSITLFVNSVDMPTQSSWASCEHYEQRLRDARADGFIETGKDLARSGMCCH